MYYSAKAIEALGDKDEAKKRFNAFIEYANII